MLAESALSWQAPQPDLQTRYLEETGISSKQKSNHWLRSARPYLTNMAKRGLQWPRRLKECWCFQQRMPARAIGLMPPLRLCSVLQCRLFHVAAQAFSQTRFGGRVSRTTVDNARLRVARATDMVAMRRLGQWVASAAQDSVKLAIKGRAVSNPAITDQGSSPDNGLRTHRRRHNWRLRWL